MLFCVLLLFVKQDIRFIIELAFTWIEWGTNFHSSYVLFCHVWLLDLRSLFFSKRQKGSEAG